MAENDDLVFEPHDSEIGVCEDVCFCRIPSTENLVFCNGPNCPIAYFHAECVRKYQTCEPSTQSTTSCTGDQPVAETEWLCHFCTDSNETNRETNDPGQEEEPLTSSSGPSSRKTNTRQPKTRFGTSTKTPGEIKSQASFFAKESISQLASDPVYQDTELGQRVIKLAEQIDLSSENFERATSVIVDDLVDIISSAKDKVVGPIANTFILQQFHEYRISEKVYGVLQEVTSSISCDMDCAMFFNQYFLRSMLQNILKFSRGEEIAEDHVALSAHDEQVLRYVAGYIPYALLKRYGRQSSDDAEDVVNFLKSWKKDDDDGTEADTFLEYTKIWITIQNRGGLFFVSDKIYMLFRAMERVTRKQLQVRAMHDPNETIKETIIKNIYGSHHVQNLWHALASDLKDRISSRLLETVINYWAKIRIAAYVKSYVTMKRQESSKAKQGKKALRKELKNREKKA